jgi:kynurenine formamidase
MRIDLTYPIQKEQWNSFLEAAATNKDFDRFGHFGTHFDVMDKEFSLDNCERAGRIFDVRDFDGNEIDVQHIDVDSIVENDFVIFFTGVLDEAIYGTPEYFSYDLALSQNLIDCLIERKVSLIGVDMQGVRHGAEHRIADQLCAESGIYIIENLYDLKKLVQEVNDGSFTVHTYPVVINGATGLPTRVVAEI